MVLGLQEKIIALFSQIGKGISRLTRPVHPRLGKYRYPDLDPVYGHFITMKAYTPACLATSMHFWREPPTYMLVSVCILVRTYSIAFSFYTITATIKKTENARSEIDQNIWNPLWMFLSYTPKVMAVHPDYKRISN